MLDVRSLSSEELDNILEADKFDQRYTECFELWCLSRDPAELSATEVNLLEWIEREKVKGCSEGELKKNTDLLRETIRYYLSNLLEDHLKYTHPWAIENVPEPLIKCFDDPQKQAVCMLLAYIATHNINLPSLLDENNRESIKNLTICYYAIYMLYYHYTDMWSIIQKKSGSMLFRFKIDSRCYCRKWDITAKALENWRPRVS